MARYEADREDLMVEATALIERAEIAVDQTTTLVVGFRRDGAMSCYFGPEPVYQFNSLGQLRRAYVNGCLIKAERGRLVSMRRDREGTGGSYHTSRISDQIAAELMQEMVSLLREAAERISTSAASIVRQVPGPEILAAAELSARIVEELHRVTIKGKIADRPNL